MCLLCILLPILIGLIAAILGYLLGRLTRKSATPDCSEFQNKISLLENELEVCRSKSASHLAEIEKLKTEIPKSAMGFAAVPEVEEIAFDAALAASVFGKKIKKDDLKIVEGIGPKIAELFNSSGINTWKALSELSVEECKKVLESGGERFTLHNPGTWPKQSQLAYQGKWQELKDWQDTLDGGK